MLGGRITAEQAASWGLIWSVVDDDRLDDEVRAVAEQLARCSPDAMTRIRQSVDAAFSNSLSRQLDLEMEHQAVLIPRNMPEGAAAFLERREPTFDGRRADRS
jgi:2-(1,2-epoxy-1,2-dihydrophenyl)acetyl-CoA isomerase